MPYYTDSQIKKAKKIDLLTYLQNNNPDELVYDSKDTYCTKTHDSLKINNGMWYWFSRGIGGKTALEYLIQVEDYSFTEAVGHLINQKGLEKKHIPKEPLTDEEKKDRFVLPKKSDDTYRVIRYLTGRGISKKIIDYCMNKGFIYQESITNNVVFVGYDNNNNPRYAMRRSTIPIRFMNEASGSDKDYSFKLEANSKNECVHLFESAIDLLSYATIIELNNGDWQAENLLSLAGVYQSAKDITQSKTPKALIKFLEQNPNIKKIYIHFDNDKTGRLSTKAIQLTLSASYEIIDMPPKIGKDMNNYLCYFRKNMSSKTIENCR